MNAKPDRSLSYTTDTSELLQTCGCYWDCYNVFKAIKNIKNSSFVPHTTNSREHNNSESTISKSFLWP